MSRKCSCLYVKFMQFSVVLHFLVSVERDLFLGCHRFSKQAKDAYLFGILLKKIVNVMIKVIFPQFQLQLTKGLFGQ